jgi:HAD superfamily hydrolase (TIGR01484 family)
MRPDSELFPVHQISNDRCRALRGVFCDIDDTLTWEGRIVPDAFAALEALKAAGLRVVPITGRPAGWVDHIARTWPVDGVVGENGGLWFYMSDGKLQRRFHQTESVRAENRRRLNALADLILREVPGAALASDQPYRELDLAIDFCEDVKRLSETEVNRIVEEFHHAGATCKVSSIHVNGWYGAFDKFEGCKRFVGEHFGESLEETLADYAYFGDSANDEPMFAKFPLSVGVANVRHFLDRMDAWPRFVTRGNGGYGFAEAVDHLLSRRQTTA